MSVEEDKKRTEKYISENWHSLNRVPAKEKPSNIINVVPGSNKKPVYLYNKRTGKNMLRSIVNFIKKAFTVIFKIIAIIILATVFSYLGSLMPF